MGLNFMEACYLTHSPKEIVALITWLPEESAFVASMRGGRRFLGWSWDRLMSTLLLEQTQMNGFNFIKANTDPKKGRALKGPEPIDFPGRPARRKPGAFGPIIRRIAAGARPPDVK